MCLAKAFIQWKGYSMNDGTGIYSPSFPFDNFRTWTRVPIYGCLITAPIVLSLLLTMATMIKYRFAECILYHLQNFSCLHTYRSSIKVLWKLMFLCFFYTLIRRITLLAGLWIYVLTNNVLIYPTNDKGMLAILVIPPSRWSLLPDRIICNGEFYLVLFISSSYRAHYCTYYWLLCDSVAFISIWRSPSIAKSITSRFSCRTL